MPMCTVRKKNAKKRRKKELTKMKDDKEMNSNNSHVEDDILTIIIAGNKNIIDFEKIQNNGEELNQEETNILKDHLQNGKAFVANFVDAVMKIKSVKNVIEKHILHVLKVQLHLMKKRKYGYVSTIMLFCQIF